MSVSQSLIGENRISQPLEREPVVRNLLVMLGTPIDAVTMDAALDRIDKMVAVGRAAGRSHQIATVNADFVVKALGDPQLRAILQDADLLTADGMPLVWGARMLGVPLKGRVTGVDMVDLIAERACLRNYSLYFLGAAPGVAQRAADILCARHPGLRVVGVESPPHQAVANNEPSILAAIHAADPDILFVAFGNPKQEKWIHAHAAELHTPVMMGVGGAFDFIAGVTKRAPQWMQDSGLEWLHRLLREPRRLWRRYAVDLVGFGFYFLCQLWVMRRRQSTPHRDRTDPSLHVVDDTVVLPIVGSLDAGNHLAFADIAQTALSTQPYLIIDLADAEFLDSSAIGMLVALTKQARMAGGNVWLASAPPPISRVLTLLRLEHFLDLCTDLDSALAQCRGVRSGQPQQTAVGTRAA